MSKKSQINKEARTAIFVRETPWDSIYPISTRMLAEQFSKHGWNIFWLTPPLMPWHRRRNKSEFSKLITQHQSGGIWYGSKVFAFTPRSFVPFSRHFPFNRPFLTRWMWYSSSRSIKNAYELTGFPKPDLLWLSTWNSLALKQIMPTNQVVFHMTDNYQSMRLAPPTIEQVLRRNFKEVEHIIVPSPSLARLLVSRYKVAQENISIVLHGVDLHRFIGQNRIPLPIASTPKPRAVALGNTKNLAYDILSKLAEGIPDLSIVIIGPRIEPVRQLAQQHENIYAIGPITPEEVPDYLMACDLGLILYGNQISERVDQVNPMKLYEYAAAGLPVVSTPLPIYEFLDIEVFEVKGVEQVVSAVKSALNQEEVQRFNSKKFAFCNSWESRYWQVMRTLNLGSGELLTDAHSIVVMNE